VSPAKEAERRLRPETRRRLNEALTTLARLSNSQRLAAVHASRSGVHLSLTAVSVLRRLDDHGPQTMSQLAERCQLAPPPLSRQVRGLELAGHVVRTPNPADGRSTMVDVTARGRAALAAFGEANAELLDVQLASWSDEELTALSDQIQRLVADLRAVREVPLPQPAPDEEPDGRVAAR
jgi:DNA-binding MarR family transcriptional regulator